MMRQLAVLVLIQMVNACSSQTAPGPLPFEAALDKHLAAITNRNITDFESTITRSDNLLVILGNGETMESKAAILEFHRDWFADESWLFKPQVVSTMEGTEQASALIRYDFQSSTTAPTTSAWLLLIFERQNTEWRLIHDQNTPISQ